MSGDAGGTTAKRVRGPTEVRALQLRCDGDFAGLLLLYHHRDHVRFYGSLWHALQVFCEPLLRCQPRELPPGGVHTLTRNLPDALGYRFCVAKSTYVTPKRVSYPSAHSKLSRKPGAARECRRGQRRRELTPREVCPDVDAVFGYGSQERLDRAAEVLNAIVVPYRLLDRHVRFVLDGEAILRDAERERCESSCSYAHVMFLLDWFVVPLGENGC